jgi:hypothetical protein
VRIQETNQRAAFEGQALGRLDCDGVRSSQGTIIEQRQLAEHVAWQKHREHDLRTGWAGSGDLDLSFQDQMKVQTRITLAKDVGAGAERAFVKIGHESLQIRGVDPLEKSRSLKDLQRVHIDHLLARRQK